MNPYKYIKQILQRRCIVRRKKANSDFSAFVSAIPLTRKQLLIEECKKQDVSIYIDDPSEQSTGAYAIFRGVASEAELERRLNAKKVTIFSKRANVIAFAAFTASVIPLIVPTIALIKPFL